jgi:predicted metal-dependent peptidase
MANQSTKSTKVELTTEEKLSKCKIQLNKKSPFFSYLVEYLKMIEKEEVMSMGVDARNNMYYNKDFVDKLGLEELKGVLCHEVLHLAFRHPARGVGRNLIIESDPPISLWNIAIDLWVNHTVIENGFKLPAEGIIPQNGSYDFGNVRIDNIPEKSVEEIYEELKVNSRQGGKGKSGKQGNQQGSQKGQGGQGNQQGQGGQGGQHKLDKVGESFDEHMWGKDGEDGKDGKDGDGQGEQQRRMPVDWNHVVARAYNHAKMCGKEPAGVLREFGELYKPKVNWKNVLRKAIASKIPYDFTYSRPSRKFISQDIYMPSTYGEKIKVIVSLDTSGSISPEELTRFMSEIVGIYKSFVEVDFWVLPHDVEVHNPISVNTYSIGKLLKMKPEGGGGTSHCLVYDYIRKNRLERETKILVAFTDGYSTYPEKRPTVSTVFVLAGHHCLPKDMPKWSDKVIVID